MQYCLNIPVQGFRPLNIEIAEFPDGFHLKIILKYMGKKIWFLKNTGYFFLSALHRHRPA